MAFERFTTSVLNVSALPDRVTGQATTLKAVFDKAGVDIKTALNGLMDQLEALTAAGNIGAEVDSTVANTVQGILTAFDTAIGNRYTKAETNTLVASNTNDLVKTITFNGDTGVFTITKADNTTVTIDTALEKVPATFELIESSGTYYLRITNLDGSYTQTNVTELMNVYTFSNSSTIAFTKTTNGNTNEISANIRDNSITMDKLALSALTSIQGYVEQAGDSATAAGNSATNASTSATASQSWAEGGTNTRTGENTNNAKYYSEQASSSATDASGSAENANGSASTATSKATLAESWAKGGTNSRSGEDTNNAKYYSEQASSSAEGASGSASTASNKATEAQSWAVGGTGTREGEDTNNAKYWCEQAEGASAGGDMRKAVYDIDNNGIVDNSEKLEGHSADYFQSLEVAESLLPTDTGTGENVDIDNAQPYKVLNVVADGKYQQDTTTGKNLFSTELEQNARNNADGSSTIYAAYYIRTKNKISVKPNTTYYLSYESNASFQGGDIQQYRENEEYISNVALGTAPQTYTTPNDCYYINIQWFRNTGIVPTDITNIQLEEGSTATSYEPYTGGIPSPNPDYPQPITQVTSAIWNRVGKNLFDKDKIADNYYYNSSGTTTMDGTNRFINKELPLCNNYTFSYKSKVDSGGIIAYVRLLEYDINNNFIKRTLIYTNNATIATDSNTKKVIASVDDGPNAYFEELQIEQGSGTTYSPYQGQSIPIDLDGNEVCATDTKKDKLLVDRYGNVAIQKNVDKVVLNGSENWEFWTTKELTQVFSIKKADMGGEPVTSNMFTYNLSGDTEKIAASLDSSIWRIYIAILKTRASTVEEFKTWLSTHNTTVYYLLATPQIIPLPKLSILPTTLKGINHIWVDTNLGRTDIEVEYVKDLSLAIPDELADLTDDSTHRLTTDAEKTAWNGKANKATYTATIPTTGWSASAPYTQTISVTGMLATDANFPVSPVYSSTLATRQAQQEAWGKVSMIEAGADSITVTCDEEVPTEAIPIQIMVVR